MSHEPVAIQGYCSDDIRVISPGLDATKRVTTLTTRLVLPRSHKVGLTSISTC
jgi:hypothetical protein